ncbi:NB-ARC domain-containing protein [Streptomyces radicis]|uniref:NB-ARC domain-containing protein n=1 Tax=Streptomyces radicis TaxID=1750517 RepID=A0A3A9WGL0_9ACTN|nr:NB-ARC domain-containing protein [Streptomyces radicis]RKN11443.1 hypothetical protein D7319_05740 [Streptomyces radicis]RKN26537.1 hypothetical protein D7318_03920 [Streptomyces radicis]
MTDDPLTDDADRAETRNDFSGEASTVIQVGAVQGDIVLPRPATAAPPAMAPPPPFGFVPRPELGREIVNALPGPVALCGPGGYGKTSLASWACRDPEIGARFPGGVLWVELGQRPTAARIVSSLAQLAAVLSGSAPAPYADVPAAAQAFRSALGDRRALLVVDDVWSAADLRPFLDATPLLATTRRTGLLGDLGTEIRVDDMTEAEATAVLGDGADVAPLLRRVGRWPLALGLLSGILRSLVHGQGMSADDAVTALLDELAGHGITALDELSDADSHRGITRTLELSLADLPDDSRRRLVSLAAFPAGEAVPHRVLRRLWGLSDLRTRLEAERLTSRSLVTGGDGRGPRLHDVTREALRRREPGRPAEVSAQLLDALRPAGGWHELPDEERPFLATLAFHLRQAGRADELAALLRASRFLALRIAASGPAAVEADLGMGDDAYARELGGLLRREGHLLTGGLAAHDIELTLATRLFGSASPLDELRARAIPGLVALHPPPDRDDEALLRSFPAHPEGACQDIDWHPEGELLATAGYGPQLRIITAEGRVERSVEIEGAVIDRVRWSPDGTRLAVVGERDRDGVATLSVHDPATGAQTDAVRLSRERGFPESFTPGFRWSPDSRALAVLSADGVLLWTPGSGEEPTLLPGGRGDHRAMRRTLDWHPERGLLVAGTSRWYQRAKEIRLWRWTDVRRPARESALPVPELPAPAGRADRLAWRPGGSTAVLGHLLLDPLAGEVRWRAGARSDMASWSPEGDRLAIRRWRPEAGQLVLSLWRVPRDAELAEGQLPVPTGEIDLGVDHSRQDSLAWRPDGGVIATTTGLRVIRLWRRDAPGGARGDGGPAALREVAWSPDGATLRVRARDKSWFAVDPDPPEPDWRHRAPRRLPDAAERDETTLTFDVPTRTVATRDGRIRAVAPWFQPPRVTDRSAGTTTELTTPEGLRRWDSLCFTPSGDRFVAAVSRDDYTAQGLLLWPLTGAERAAPAARWMTGGLLSGNAGESPVISLRRVTASETHVAVIASAGLIGLFALPDLRPLCWIRTNATVVDAAFAPGGRRLAVVGDAGLHVFHVSDDDRLRTESDRGRP